MDLWPIATKFKVDAAHPQLMALLAAEARKIGNAPMLEYLLRNATNLSAKVAACQAVESALDAAKYAKTETADILWKHCDITKCRCSTKFLWVHRARHVLAQNGITEAEFTGAVLRDLLEAPTAKANVVTLIGRKGNNAKSWLLQPLTSMLAPEVFANAPGGQFPVLGLPSCRILFLDDLRWDDSSLTPSAMLSDCTPPKRLFGTHDIQSDTTGLHHLQRGEFPQRRWQIQERKSPSAQQKGSASLSFTFVRQTCRLLGSAVPSLFYALGYQWR